MTTKATILDTGPLVAFLEAREEHHAWVSEQFRNLPPNFLTCEAVLTEAFHLLGYEPKAMEQIEKFLARGWIQAAFQFSAQQGPVMNLLRAYRNIPMSLADACLVRMAELHGDLSVFTLDRHFLVYRKHRRQPIATILPPV